MSDLDTIVRGAALRITIRWVGDAGDGGYREAQQRPILGPGRFLSHTYLRI